MVSMGKAQIHTVEAPRVMDRWACKGRITLVVRKLLG